MKITISGDPGSGKSTIAKMLQKKLHYNYVSVGMLMRKLAKERGITLLELSKQAKTDKTIDKYLDDSQKNIKDENIIIDSRLGFHFFQDAFKIFLLISDTAAAERIFKQKRSFEQNYTYEKTLNDLKKRKNSEYKRYKQYYDIDLSDNSKFDLVIDTTDKIPNEIVELIMQSIKKYKG